MAEEHTEAKLVLFEGDDKTTSIHPAGDDSFRSPVVHWLGFDDTGSVSHDQDRANARRIVACWNALSGLSTADIEGGVVREMVEALRDVDRYLGGWREMVAELDDYVGPTATGRAMLAALNQIDRTKPKIQSALPRVKPLLEKNDEV